MKKFIIFCGLTLVLSSVSAEVAWKLVVPEHSPIQSYRKHLWVGEFRNADKDSVTHFGFDIKAELGAPVYPVACGIVLPDKSNKTLGKVVHLRHIGIGKDGVFLQTTTLRRQQDRQEVRQETCKTLDPRSTAFEWGCFYFSKFLCPLRKGRRKNSDFCFP